MIYYTYHINSGWKKHNDTNLALVGYQDITKLCLPLSLALPDSNPLPLNYVPTITIEEQLQVQSKNNGLGTDESISISFNFDLYQNNTNISAILNEPVYHKDIYVLEPTTLKTLEFRIPDLKHNNEDKYYLVISANTSYVYARGINDKIKASITADTNFLITFVGTSEIKTQKYPLNEGEKYEYPKVQPPIGYKYNGEWQTADGKKYDLTTQPTKDITLYPHYEPIYKTISFVSTGLKNNFTYDYSVKINDHIIFSAPIHKYYKFSQWSNGSSNSKIDFIIGPEYFTTDENISFTASYINDASYPLHTLTLDANKITYRNNKIYLPANYNNTRVQYWKPQNSSIYFSPYLEYDWNELSEYQYETFTPIYMGKDYPIYPLFFKDANDNWVPISNLYEKGESEWK